MEAILLNVLQALLVTVLQALLVTVLQAILSPKVRRLIEKTIIGVGCDAPQDYKPKEINDERTNIADKEPENDYDDDDKGCMAFLLQKSTID